MSRDIHSPAAFDPAAYDYIGAFYQGPTHEDFDPSEFTDEGVVEALEASAYRGNHHAKGTCDHCGARFYYGAAFRHRPTGDVIAVGNRCSADAFGRESRAAYEISRLKARVEALRRRQEATGAARAFLDLNPGLDAALGAEHYISRDLAAKLLKYGSLSVKQVALAFKLAADVANRDAEDAEREAKVAVAPPWTAGRQDIDGVLLATKTVETDFGSSTKMLVELPDGRRCWGSVPEALWAGAGPMRGRSVAFRATFQPAPGDPKFAFFKRPSNARIVAAPGATVAPEGRTS